MMSIQKAEFQDRIARIKAGSGTCKATVFVGQDLRFTYAPRHRKAGRRAISGSWLALGLAGVVAVLIFIGMA